MVTRKELQDAARLTLRLKKECTQKTYKMIYDLLNDEERTASDRSKEFYFVIKYSYGMPRFWMIGKGVNRVSLVRGGCDKQTQQATWSQLAGYYDAGLLAGRQVGGWLCVHPPSYLYTDSSRSRYAAWPDGSTRTHLPAEYSHSQVMGAKLDERHFLEVANGFWSGNLHFYRELQRRMQQRPQPAEWPIYTAL